MAAEQAAEAAEKAAKEAAWAAAAKTGVKGEIAQRSTGFRTQWKATAITNLGDAFAYYKAKPEVSELLLRLASADARSGRRRIPGFRIEEIKSVA